MMSSLEKYVNRKNELVDELYREVKGLKDLVLAQKETMDNIEYIKIKLRYIDIEIKKIKNE